MTADELVAIAESNGWNVDQLILLFEYKWDQLNPADKTVSGIIHRAIDDGDDWEWIKEMVEMPPK